MDQEYYKPPKAGFLMRTFWKAAGADRTILEKSTYSDHVKYACLGGIVAATGVMAALAGGYAFYIIFEPKGDALGTLNTATSAATEPIDIPTVLLSILFGIIWGLIIFNIDRFIVTSTGKGDGTEAITKQEIKSAIPRIIMGIIIAITISKPLEIRMFKTEIDVKLREKQQEQEAAFKRKTEANYQPFITEAENKIKSIRQETQKKEIQRDALRNKLEEEIAGRVGSGKSGDGPAARQIRTNLNNVEEEYKELVAENKAQIAVVKEERDKWRTILKEELTKGKKTAEGLDGLLERIKIAHEIAGWGISLFITLLFMAIELTPIFFKMMLIKSPYDFIEDNIKDLIMAEHGIEIQQDVFPHREGQDKHLVVHHSAKKKLKEKIDQLRAEAALRDAILQNWHSDEIDKIKKDEAEET